MVRGAQRRDRACGACASAGRVSVALMLLILQSPLVAQHLSDTLRLREMVVVAPRLVGMNVGARTTVVDSTAFARHATADLGTLLTNESSVFIKSYGLGSLATTAFRGGSANHTAVLWNGFNLGSPMNGQLDLSLVPVLAANDVRIEHGGATALWGSGAVGGTIHLNNVPRFARGPYVEVGASVGSFGDLRQQVSASVGHARWSASVALFHTAARNDFRYAVDGVNAERRQVNAQLEQRGSLVQLHHQINARQRISIGYWYQYSDRGIPPTLQQGRSTAEQRDESHRLTAAWQYAAPRSVWHVRSAWFHEGLRWFPFDATAVDSRSRTAIAEGEWRFRPGRGHLLILGLNATHAAARSDGYADAPQQLRSALFGAYTYTARSERWSASASARQERMDQRLVPFTANIGAQMRVWPGAQVKASVSKLYRVPTFNDLYWVPGGVRDLLPESGHGGEVGVALDRKVGRVTVNGEVTTYSRTMDQWIIWLPGPAYWSPQNVMQVWSRGVEAGAEAVVPMGRSKLSFALNTDHVVSTNQRAKSADDASVDKQLIYTPMYSGRARIGLQRGRFSATCIAMCTGYRYTSTDNRSFLEPFTVANAWLAYTLRTGKRGSVSVDLQCNNLFDARYQVIADRPMPLRHYRIGVRYQFGER
ncbi:MAG: TonB-dependent receptor [Flavobacteriales bacterium]